MLLTFIFHSHRAAALQRMEYDLTGGPTQAGGTAAKAQSAKDRHEQMDPREALRAKEMHDAGILYNILIVLLVDDDTE